jgi:hypothetical protein
MSQLLADRGIIIGMRHQTSASLYTAFTLRCCFITKSFAVMGMNFKHSDNLTAVTMQVLREYQRRDGLMSQLLADREQLRREASRSAADATRAEKQRADAQRATERVKVGACSHMAAPPHTFEPQDCTLWFCCLLTRFMSSWHLLNNAFLTSG